MGHESSSEEDEESGRAKRRKREKRRKKDDTDVGLESLNQVGDTCWLAQSNILAKLIALFQVAMDHEDILKACDEHMKKAQDEMTLSRRKRKRSSSRMDRELEKKSKKKKKERRKNEEEEGPSKARLDDSPGKKNPLEMLELEMRARAIKALLLKADQKEAEKEKKMIEMMAVAVKEEADDDVEIIEETLTSVQVERASSGPSNILASGTSSSLSELKVNNSSPSHQKESNCPENLTGEEQVLPGGGCMKKDEADSSTVTVLQSNAQIETGENKDVEAKEEDAPQKVWMKKYDKELPEAITSMCLGGVCRLCKVDFNSDAECEEHYLNEKHLKRVGEKLEVLFADRPGEPIGWRQNLVPRLLPAVKDDVKQDSSMAASLVSPKAEEEKVLDVKERRPYHREWTQLYDRAMPESILNLCLENECKLCKATLKHEVMAKQHFEGKTHAKNVNLELEEIYKATGMLKDVNNV